MQSGKVADGKMMSHGSKTWPAKTAKGNKMATSAKMSHDGKPIDGKMSNGKMQSIFLLTNRRRDVT